MTDQRPQRREDELPESVSNAPLPEQPPMTNADGLPHNSDTEDET